MRQLKVTSGPAVGQSLEVEEELVIGRVGADLTISDPEVSRRHAVIRAVHGGVIVEDLDSLNGTYVNGERIMGAVTLTSGAMIRVGKSDIEVQIAPLAETTISPPRIIPAAGSTDEGASVAEAPSPAAPPTVPVPTPGEQLEDAPPAPPLPPPPAPQRPPPPATAGRPPRPLWLKLALGLVPLAAAVGLGVGLYFALG